MTAQAMIGFSAPGAARGYWRLTMLTKKRLEELRARVFADCQEWDVKCSKDGFQEATPTGKMDSDGNDLTALIDAEIARQSMTSEEAVQRAIDSFEMCKDMMLFDPQTGETHALEDENQDNQDLYHACNLAQVALHQMRTEPCEWCAEKEDSLLVWTKDPVEIEWDDREYTTRGKRAGSEEIMKRFTKLLRIEYEDKWVVEDAFEDESGLIRGKAIDCLAQYETANEGLGCEECFGVAGMEIPLSTGIKSVNFCPICGRRF
jgi:hypothetical protein